LVVEIPADAVRHDGHRARAAPHIKTYIRYNGNATIDWALLTSANLSKQAWGEAARQQTGEVRIASWEIGVLVWPELLAEGSVMVPTFGNDDDSDDSATNIADKEQTGPVLGVRVPYNMPLQRYGAGETPWVASLNHTEPDRHGGIWMGET
jgi:tyrosyl-DNA phosphodiesterase 1